MTYNCHIEVCLSSEWICSYDTIFINQGIRWLKYVWLFILSWVENDLILYIVTIIIRTVSSNLLKRNPKILPQHELIPCSEKQALAMLKVNIDGENFIWRLRTYKFDVSLWDQHYLLVIQWTALNNTRFSRAVLPGHVLTN